MACSPAQGLGGTLTPLCACALQDRLASGENIFGPLIQKYLLKNQHRVSARVLPDKELAAKQDAAEKEKLQQRMGTMSPQEVEAVVAEMAELKHQQASA